MPAANWKLALSAFSYDLYRVGHKKCGTLLVSISLPISDRFSKFFHWHTLWTICNMKCACITIITNKHFGKIEKKHQINITVNDPYDTWLCGSNTV